MATTSSTIITVADCIGEIIAEVMVRRPELAGRLAKAATLVDLASARAVFPQGEPGCYYVHSAAQDGTLYLVDATHGTCTCKWGQHGNGSPCAHVLACRLIRAASYVRNQRQRSQDYGLPLRDPAADVARFVA